MKTVAVSAAAALLAVALGAPNVDATPLKCQRAIAKASAAFVQARAKALASCEEAIVRTGSGSCPDEEATTAIAKATARLTAVIDTSCGGDDRVCGGDLTGEDSPASIGWPTECPNFERGSCDFAIQTCGDVAGCLACIANTAVDQAIDLYYDDLLLPSAGDLNTCQRTIGKATSAFLVAKSKALRKCWHAKLNGKLAPAATCIDPDPGDGKYLAAIEKAENKKKATICKACGGDDDVCDGVNDIDPATIGFATDCPAVAIPGGTACGGPITDLTSLVACVDCVTEFKVDCVDRAAVPGMASYPSECGACTEPAPSGACPSAVEYTVAGPAFDLDLGFTGLAHDIAAPSNVRLTFAVGGCAGANQPTCGECSLSGPVPNVGGGGFDNQRCQDQPWVACGTDLDCSTAGAAGPCTYFFGPPQSFSLGGIPTCFLNRIAGPVSGTVNLDDGSSQVALTYAAGLHAVGPLAHPCPICRRVCSNDSALECTTDGECGLGTCGPTPVCSAGPRALQPCTPQGDGIFGPVSLDCPPNPGALAGTHQLAMNLTTGTAVRTLTSASPQCRQTGFTSLKCFCGSCNNANAEPCFTNADCPLSGGNPGICDGRRCLGGGNNGAPCAIGTECPGGSCTRPGEFTQPNSCSDDANTPGLDCVDVGNGEGECVAGPTDSACSIDTFRSCLSADDCNSPPTGTCDECPAGNQTCVQRNRPCFPDNGLLGNSVTVTGKPEAACGGIAKPTSGALFCVGPFTTLPFNPFNFADGLPGLGRVRIPSVMRTLP